MSAFRLPLTLAIQAVPLTLSFTSSQFGAAVTPPSFKNNGVLSHQSLFSAQRKTDDDTLSRAIELINSRAPRTEQENFQDLVEAMTGVKDINGKEQSPEELARSLLRHMNKMLS